MTIAVGLLLLGVFLAFALLMFLEKLSALLALPLMAFSFLIVAAVADLLAAPQEQVARTVVREDALGRRQTTIEAPTTAPSRFTLWRRMRHAQLEALHQRAEFFADSVEAAGTALQTCTAQAEPDCAEALRQEIQRVRSAEQRLVDTTLGRFADENIWPRFFARPPYFAG
ncbi:MAG TPA: hypothetical protein P5572_00005, partial [Phycisphaerae bacterium]|nr:hypothetical protein [Phycisphaerae bacterium]